MKKKNLMYERTVNRFVELFPFLVSSIAKYIPNGENSIRIKCNNSKDDFIFEDLGCFWSIQPVRRL